MISSVESRAEPRRSQCTARHTVQNIEGLGGKRGQGVYPDLRVLQVSMYQVLRSFRRSYTICKPPPTVYDEHFLEYNSVLPSEDMGD
jgi:hypothetical protein